MTFMTEKTFLQTFVQFMSKRISDVMESLVLY